MRHLLSVSIILLYFSSTCTAQRPQSYELDGIYQGTKIILTGLWNKDIKELNCETAELNRKTILLEKGRDTLVIDPERYGIHTGDSVHLNFYAKQFIYLNYHDFIGPKEYMISELRLENDSLFYFTANTNGQQMMFFVEQFKWNKWVTIAKTEAFKDTITHVYKLDVAHAVHFGLNTIRVKTFRYELNVFQSILSITSNKPNVEVPTLNTNRKLEFTHPTSYEVYDKFGNIVGKSYGKTINTSKLTPDVYYLNYDNKTTEFIKMK